MDMQMPEMDGYQATSILQQHGFDRLIVALIAHAMSGESQRCLDAGCVDFCTKPISPADLKSAVLKNLKPLTSH